MDNTHRISLHHDIRLLSHIGITWKGGDWGGGKFLPPPNIFSTQGFIWLLSCKGTNKKTGVTKGRGIVQTNLLPFSNLLRFIVPPPHCY